MSSSWWQTFLTIISFQWVYDHLGAPMSAIALSALISLGVGFWLYRKNYDEPKIGLISFGVFVAVLWAVLMIEVLSQLEKHYDYGLAYQNIIAIKSQDGDIQVAVSFVNVSPTAIKYEVKDMRVVIGNVTLPRPKFDNEGGVIPRGVGRLYRYPGFSKAIIKDYINKTTPGSVEFMVNYGGYNGKFQRTLKMKLNVTFSLAGDPRIGDTIVEEKDMSYYNSEDQNNLTK